MQFFVGTYWGGRRGRRLIQELYQIRGEFPGVEGGQRLGRMLIRRGPGKSETIQKRISELLPRPIFQSADRRLPHLGRQIVHSSLSQRDSSLTAGNSSEQLHQQKSYRLILGHEDLNQSGNRLGLKPTRLPRTGIFEKRLP